MANITIRNIPDSVYEKIKQISALEKRSINNELLVIIEKGTDTEIKNIQKSKRTIPKSIQIKLWKNLSGVWEDNRTTDEIIEDIFDSRTGGRDIDL